MTIRNIGSRLELFINDWLIETIQNATIKLHPPIRREIALAFDAPWEGPGSHYITVLQYGKEFRAYYRGAREGQPNVTAMATSTDGVYWERPNLGLIEWDGSKANNIVWLGAAADTFAPFLDTNPAALPSQQFKAVAAPRIPEIPAGPGRPRRWRQMVAFTSADGLAWHPWGDQPILTDGALDSQNIAFYDNYRGHYVTFFRDFADGVRTIKTATSADFRTWSEPQWLDFGDTPPEHLYTNATVSYPRAPHIYLAFPKRFYPKRHAVADYAKDGVSDGVFMTSRDGVHWDRRFMEAFLRPGRDRENWTDRNNGIAWGILQTAPDELSLYWIEHYQHPTARLRRGTVRLDGFASVNAGYSGGEIITHPLQFTGRELVLNYATSAAGSVRAELQDATGQPLPGYSLADCPEHYGDFIEGAIGWQNGTDLSSLAGQPIRLRLVLHDADVYALRFRQ